MELLRLSVTSFSPLWGAGRLPELRMRIEIAPADWQAEFPNPDDAWAKPGFRAEPMIASQPGQRSKT